MEKIGNMTTTINGTEARCTAGWHQSVWVFAGDAAQRCREGTLLSTDTRWEEGLSAVAVLYLGASKSR